MEIHAKKPHIIGIVGPTASGKSELAVRIAKKIGGEIISADSRQVYTGMNIGSGKVSRDNASVKNNDGTMWTYKGVPHFGIDIASPKRQFSVAQFQKYAEKIITDILRRGKVPILCGGTGHWIDSVAYDQKFPAIKPNKALRAKLEKKSIEELFAMLLKKDPVRAKTIDKKNPRRLIRALEIVLSSGKPVPKINQTSPYTISWIGIHPSKHMLEQKIKQRLKKRLVQGMIKEVQALKKSGMSWAKLESFGLEYKYCALFLQKKLEKGEMIALLETAIKQYAKRQLTWFKRNKDIQWIENAEDIGAIKNLR